MISVLVPIIGSVLTAIASDARSSSPPKKDRFGAVPPPPASMAPGASVLKSAALAAPGSWTRRNVLQAGAQSAYARRLAGTATEADFAVLRAARPGIASGLSGPISPAWSGSPWQPGPGVGPGPRSGLFSEFLEDDSLDEIGDIVSEEFGGQAPAPHSAEAIGHGVSYMNYLGLRNGVAIYQAKTPGGVSIYAIWPDAQGNYPTRSPTPEGPRYSYPSPPGYPPSFANQKGDWELQRAGKSKPPGFEDATYFVKPAQEAFGASGKTRVLGEDGHFQRPHVTY